MRKGLLGQTGLEISELAFGGGVTGGILIEADEVTRYNALSRAVAAGINWVDTAPIYGEGESERTIGRNWQSLSPLLNISTKVRLEAEDVNDIPGAIERSLEQSLERLRADSIALFQLHNHLGRGVGERLALTPVQVLGRGGVADTFDRLKQQGLFRAAGMTAAGETKACLEVIDSGRFDTAQVYYNAVNPSAAWSRLPAGWSGGQNFCGILAACFQHNMGVLNIRVLAGGVLASPEPPDRLFVMTSDTDLRNEVQCASAVRRVLAGEGTPAQAALRFALGNRDLSRVIGSAPWAARCRRRYLGERPRRAKLEALWANRFRV
jgi:L-galactose dehydrogenase/L-glyceraldehyde 3-phosphate reductase